MTSYEHIWYTAFACATVQLRDWTPGKARSSEVDMFKRKEAIRLADKAVNDARLAQAEWSTHQPPACLPCRLCVDGPSTAHPDCESAFKAHYKEA